MQEIKEIIESLLFIAEEPLTVEKLRTILETAETRDIQNALKTLSEEYDQRGGGFMLREVAGGWQIRSRPEYNEWIKRMLQPSPQRLSRAALETLAVIAYKQPIIRADIEHIRGVDCGGVLRQLMERKIIRVLGRKEIAGRPLIYATTKLFLEMFDLKDLNDLPTPKEIAELGNAMIDSQQAGASERPPLQQDAAGDHEAHPQEDDPLMVEAETEALASQMHPEPLSAVPSEEDGPLPGEALTEPEAQELEVSAYDEETESEIFEDDTDTGYEDLPGDSPMAHDDPRPTDETAPIQPTVGEDRDAPDIQEAMDPIDGEGNDTFDEETKNS